MKLMRVSLPGWKTVGEIHTAKASTQTAQHRAKSTSLRDWSKSSKAKQPTAYPSGLLETKSSAGEKRPLPYAALSYCWGGEQSFKLTHDRVTGWRSSIPYEELPQTLKDAFIVCLKLGIGCLWVDALCILQDDVRDKTVQIANMPAIYRNSAVTITAASASAASQGFLAR